MTGDMMDGAVGWERLTWDRGVWLNVDRRDRRGQVVARLFGRSLC